MCMKFSFEDFNSGPYLSYSTSTYTCEVTIASKVRGGGWLLSIIDDSVL